MAIAHPGLSSLKRYLKTRFAWKLPWHCEMTGEVFTAKEVEQALGRVKEQFPDEWYELLGYCWLSYRTRIEIADARYLDPSTVKRAWDRLMHYMKIELSYGHLLQQIEGSLGDMPRADYPGRTDRDLLPHPIPSETAVG